MKQIGYRQEAAKVGGIGSCGRELCCSTWLTDFRSVNTQAARYQQLSINPQKLAGQCGKLKCCLNYELDSYVDALSDFPSSSTVLDTEKGRAFCIKIDVFKRKMWFAYVENSMSWYDLDIQIVKKVYRYE
jgi:cell fate regulator YaaT (PSP1 superfamily)